ncbi:MAG TPA: hypothetical protein VMA73_10100 [Streptosporangiaceae bacterium]|nr:hypothetical protein [Streptosporangiaceae bacterium]
MADVVSDGDSLRDVEFSAEPELMQAARRRYETSPGPAELIDAAVKILPNLSLFRSRHRPDPTHRTTYSATPGDDATVRPVAAS